MRLGGDIGDSGDIGDEGVPPLRPFPSPVSLRSPRSPVPVRFWYHTGTNSAVFTWENVFLLRDPDYPATFQAELWPDGSYAYRYALLSTNADYSAVLTNFFIGTTHGGVEIFFGPPPEPTLTIPQGHVCFHTPLPHPVEAKVEPEGAFDGTFTWTYGNLTLTNNPVLLPRSDGWKTNWPGTVSVTFEVGGKAYATNCPVWYCQLAGDGPSTNAPPGGASGDGEWEYCWRCGSWWYAVPPGSDHGCDNGGDDPEDPHGPGEGEEKPEEFNTYVHRGLVPEHKVRGFPIEEQLVRFYPHGGPGGGRAARAPSTSRTTAPPQR